MQGLRVSNGIPEGCRVRMLSILFLGSSWLRVFLPKRWIHRKIPFGAGLFPRDVRYSSPPPSIARAADLLNHSWNPGPRRDGHFLNSKEPVTRKKIVSELGRRWQKRAARLAMRVNYQTGSMSKTSIKTRRSNPTTRDRNLSNEERGLSIRD